MVLGTGADAAHAANTGGAAAGSTAPTSSPAPSKPALHLFPVTSRSSNIAYKGPVYLKTSSGQVVPYSPTAGTTTGSVASATGGSAPSGAKATSGEPKAMEPGGLVQAGGPTLRPQLLVP